MNFSDKLENKKFATENTEGTEKALSSKLILCVCRDRPVHIVLLCFSL